VPIVIGIMVKVRVTDKGIIAEPGSGFEGTPTKMPSVTKTANTTLTSNDAGVIIMSASAGALTMTLPTAASAIGGMYVFRSTSPSAHIISASSNTGNTIYTMSGTAVGVTSGLSLGGLAGTNASSITFPAVAGSSVALMSDGNGWGVLFGSGSLVFAKGVA
jgi:hypothetical protein